MTEKQRAKLEELKAMERAEKRQKSAEDRLHERWLKSRFGISVHELKKILKNYNYTNVENAETLINTDFSSWSKMPGTEDKNDMSYEEYTEYL